MKREAMRAKVAPRARAYRVTDKASGEDYDLALRRLVTLVGVEASYIDWCLTCDGAFENARWRVVAA